jgi:DNA-binding MarR family transcriptional regulator
MSGVLKQRIKQSVDFESPAAEAMLNLMVAADHVRTGIERTCSEYGITQGQYNVLRILRGAVSTGHPRHEIAARMIERAPDVTRLVDRLEKQGLAVRGRSGEDKRQSVTRITEKGQALLDAMRQRMAEGVSELSEKLSPAECVALTDLCEKIYHGES